MPVMDLEPPRVRRWPRMLLVIGLFAVVLTTIGWYYLVGPGVPPYETSAYKYGVIGTSQLVVNYGRPGGSELISATAEETDTTVTVRILLTPYQRAILPGSTSGGAVIESAVIDLEAPLGGRTVLDEQGRPIPEEDAALVLWPGAPGSG